MSKKVAFVVAHDKFQPIEYETPKHILENAGITVITVSNEPGIATATDGSKASVDMTLQELDPAVVDGVFFVGGPGSIDHLDGDLSHHILQRAEQIRKPYGGICLAVRILAAAGVLTEKNATGWNEDDVLPAIFESYDVTYRPDEDVVVDGIAVTAVGPDDAEEYGEAILDLLETA
jgi:protease I